MKFDKRILKKLVSIKNYKRGNKGCVDLYEDGTCFERMSNARTDYKRSRLIGTFTYNTVYRMEEGYEYAKKAYTFNGRGGGRYFTNVKDVYKFLKSL